jgi:LmbE family N-acetylglucosaminyl deacetylase
VLQGSETAKQPILAIGAHPDDIELGCGGTLAKQAAAAHPIRAIVFSKGRRGNLTESDRSEETLRALKAIGVTDVHTYGFEDTQLWRFVNEMITLIEEHVRAIKPYRVYTMFQHDRHQDHRAVYEASAIACRRVPQFLGYETPSSYPNFTPTAFEEIGDYLETKIIALRMHQSQGDRLYMQEDKIRSAANFRGAQINLGLCEGFIPYKFLLS